MKKKLLIWLPAVLAVTVVLVLAYVNRPLVKAPDGTATLDNRIDTSGVDYLIVDEADVLTEEAEKIISIYNANWLALKDRVMAVVTVESTDNAEADAWRWAERLSLRRNYALLLIECQSGRQCALVSKGTFHEDIETLHDSFLTSLTYQNLRADCFDAAVLAVFERLHYFCGYDAALHREIYVREGLTAFVVLAALMLPILIHMLAELVDNRRFRRWYKKHGYKDQATVPWRTLCLWHRVGSKWYETRVSGDWVNYRAALRESRRERSIKIYSGRYR